MPNMSWEESLKKYDAIVELCPRFTRKGKTVPYTSANGHMFSLLNKEGELGFRFSKEVQKKYIEAWASDVLHSHGATMRGYVKVPEHMLDASERLADYLNESYEHVMSLPPK
jgi:hypothetical protein